MVASEWLPRLKLIIHPNQHNQHHINSKFLNIDVVFRSARYGKYHFLVGLDIKDKYDNFYFTKYL